MDALPSLALAHEQIACIATAAEHYRIPVQLLLAIAEKENGRPGYTVPNTNGTADIGPMQFNSAYLASLQRYGISAKDVNGSDCFSYELAGWRLRQHLMRDKGDLWTRAANYHSRTPRYNAAYRADLQRKAYRWEQWLACTPSVNHQCSASIATAKGEVPLVPSSPKPYVPRTVHASRGP